MKKILIALAITIGLISLPVSSAKATPYYCGITWGSLPKSATESSNIDTLVNIRTGQHTCFDRIVLDIPGDDGFGYDVRYVSQYHAEGSGDLIPLDGGAKLRIIAHSPSYDPETGTATYPATSGQPLPGIDLTNYQTLKDAKFGGSYEGQSSIGAGVRAHLPFRVFELNDRLVIDIAHHW